MGSVDYHTLSLLYIISGIWYIYIFVVFALRTQLRTPCEHVIDDQGKNKNNKKNLILSTNTKDCYLSTFLEVQVGVSQRQTHADYWCV